MGESASQEQRYVMAVWTYERIYGAFPFACVATQFPSVAKQLRSAGVETDDGERAKQLLAKNFVPALEIALHKHESPGVGVTLPNGRVSEIHSRNGDGIRFFSGGV